MRTGEDVRIHAGYVVNAAGAWAGKIAGMAGVTVTVVPGKGTMLAMNHRFINTVVNRCKLPADGDIIVPVHTVAIIGTTDVHVPDPDVFGIEPWEVELMLEEGEQLVPGFSHMRVLRAWAGVRPLYKDQDVTDDRDISRTYKLLDHDARDGVKGLISIVGGKWTTYRLMARDAVDAVAAKLGVSAECRTHLEPLPMPRWTHASASGQYTVVGGRRGEREKDDLAARPPAPATSDISPFYWLGHRLAEIERDDTYGDLICECEIVTRDRVIRAITEGGAANVDDLRRDTRLGMGPCQGGFCTYRAVALWDEFKGFNGQALAPSLALLRQFLQERWKGLTAITWGDQLRQARLDEIIYLDTLGVDILPQPAPEHANGDGLVTAHPAIATEYHTA
jgi:glycerol-3-phosphate dehydrogenase